MTAADLEQLLIARLVRERGGTSQTWQWALGKVIVRDPGAHAHCNWDVRLSGTDRQRAAIERAIMTTQADEKEPRRAENMANIAKPKPEQRKSKA